MAHTKPLLFVLILVMVLLNLSNAQDIKNLSNLPNTISVHPWVLAFGDRVMVVWREEGGHGGSEYNTYYTVRTGNSWSRPTRTFNTASRITKNPHLNLGPDGTIHLVDADGWGDDREVFHGVYKNGTWSGRKQIYTSPENSNWMRVDVLDNNTIQVLWTSEIAGSGNLHYILRNNWKIGDSWNSTGSVVSTNLQSTGDWNLATHNDIVCQGDRTFAVWQEGSHSLKSIKFSEKQNNGNWSTPRAISLPGRMSNWPGIVADSNGNLHVIYSTIEGKVFYTGRFNGAWSTPKPINDGWHQRGFVDIDIDRGNNLHAVYQIQSKIYYNSGNSSGAWGTEAKISNGSGDELPSVSADEHGYVHIVWCSAGEGHDGDIMYRRIQGGDVPDVDAPVAVFTQSTEGGAPPLSVTFNASESYDPDGTITSYNWDFGDGLTGTGKVRNHTFTEVGVYNITLTVVDNDGLSGTASSNVFVSAPPVPRFFFTPTTGVAPLTVNFDASESSDPDGQIRSYSWLFGDGASGLGKTISHTYQDPGDYTVILEVKDDIGVTATATATLRVINVHPPQSVKYRFQINRNLFSREYLYEVTWATNPLNSQNGVNVVSYKIYRRSKGNSQFMLLGQVKSDTFSYLDRRLKETDNGNYIYAVSSVDAEGNESSRQSELQLTLNPIRLNIKKIRKK